MIGYENEHPVHGPEARAGASDREGWPTEFPVTPEGGVEEGLVVLSISGAIEGRTTGSRRRCLSIGCPGWFIGVRWETGQMMFPCSEGWAYEPAERTVRIAGGGEISARFVSPKPLGSSAAAAGALARARILDRKGLAERRQLMS